MAEGAPTRGVEAVFTNCTGPCGVVQLLRAPNGREIEVLSSLHGLKTADAGVASYRVAASRLGCRRPDPSPFIVIEALPATADDDFRVPTVRSRASLRRVRTIRVLEVADDGTTKQAACARGFLLSIEFQSR